MAHMGIYGVYMGICILGLGVSGTHMNPTLFSLEVIIQGTTIGDTRSLDYGLCRIYGEVHLILHFLWLLGKGLRCITCSHA